MHTFLIVYSCSNDGIAQTLSFQKLSSLRSKSWWVNPSKSKTDDTGLLPLLYRTFNGRTTALKEFHAHRHNCISATGLQARVFAVCYSSFFCPLALRCNLGMLLATHLSIKVRRQMRGSVLARLATMHALEWILVLDAINILSKSRTLRQSECE